MTKTDVSDDKKDAGGRPRKPEGVREVKFDVQDNVYQHLERLVRESGIAPDPNGVARHLFTVEVIRSMKDPTLYGVDDSNWKKASVDVKGGD